jgi:uncharacterized membrane protein (UPF0182 family)
VVYRFPRQETVFGPTQVEARINQEPEISAQISLWNQAGSRVLRGNLLVIPIGDSVLYVQPLYLQASESVGALPELRRVIVASSERVVMAETLSAALSQLTGSEITTGTLEPPVTEGGGMETSLEDPRVQELVAKAVAAYDRGQEALVAGDWTAYGRAQTELADVLAQLQVLTGAPVAPQADAVSPEGTPAATPIAEE